jgi:hypothetical protein
MEFAIRTIGLDGALGCINAFTSTTSNIYLLIKKFSTLPESQSITEYIQETDLELKLRVLDCIVRSIDISHDTEALALSICSLKGCISEMHCILKDIDQRLQYNMSLWVIRSVRSYGFSDLYDRLKLQSMILDDRRHLLMDVLHINKYLVPKQPSIGQSPHAPSTDIVLYRQQSST